METLLIGMVIGIAGAGLFFRGVLRRRPAASPPQPVIESFISGARAVSELSVFRVRTKEIITTSDHWLGEFGKKYLTWFLSKKQMTMIFEFVVDFRYNLTDPRFTVLLDDSHICRITLPAPNHEVQILNIRFHSEGKTMLLPQVLPEIIGNIFTGGFSVEQKNRLVEDAKQEAARLSRNLLEDTDYERDARGSARRIMEMMARGFGLDRVEVGFLPAGEFQPRIDATKIERVLPPPDNPANDQTNDQTNE